MTRKTIEKYIRTTYGCTPEYPWLPTSDHAVYRHADNRKWFAIFMRIPGQKLGIPSDAYIDVMNLKCDPLFIGSILGEKGFYPAYHMNKSHWVSAVLGACDEEQFKALLAMSFQLTQRKRM